MRTVYATLASVFPEVETWELEADDLLLIGSAFADRLRRQMRFARASPKSLTRPRCPTRGAPIDLEGFFAHYVARSSMAEALAAAEHGRLNTDDRTLVEFGFARMAADNDALSGKEIRSLARGRLEHRPASFDGDIDWSRVDEEWASFLVAEEEAEDLPDFLDKEARARLYAQAQFLEGNSDKTVSFWLSQRRDPHNPTELAALAEALANAGDDRARTHIEKLRVYQPTEAAAVYARLLARQGKTKEAAAALEATFERYRHDAWPWDVIGRHAFTTVDEVTAADPSTAERLYQAISHPLPVYLNEGRRLDVMLKIAMRTKLEVPCAKTLEPFEPHVPWQKDLLEWRSQCYSSTGDARASLAARELAEWMSQKPAAFEAGLVGSGSR